MQKGESNPRILTPSISRSPHLYPEYTPFSPKLLSSLHDFLPILGSLAPTNDSGETNSDLAFSLHTVTNSTEKL
jgi:hypothetical protein